MINVLVEIQDTKINRVNNSASHPDAVTSGVSQGVHLLGYIFPILFLIFTNNLGYDFHHCKYQLSANI